MQGPFLRKYGLEAKINFDLYEKDGSELKADAIHAAGDTKIMKDEGTEANTTNGFEGEGLGYSIALTSTEMQAARIKICVVDQTSPKAWLDTAVVIETYGNANAQYPFDIEKAAKLLINKAVQTKTTGVIEYYDDDGQTVILTHTPDDAEATITRTPS